MLTHRTFVQALAWGWAFQHPTFDNSWANNVLLFPAKPQTTPESATVGPVQAGQATSTCNVLTLMGGNDATEQHATLGPARLQSIVRQFSQEKVTIFALQETRLRTPVRLQHPEYHLWHSPANSRGQFGMMLGFTKC